MKSLEELRSAFKQSDNDGGNLPNNYYPFWKMKDGESATVRFLPDADSDNPFGFMVEKLMHTLPINGENKSVPCLKMYEDADCPICKVSSEYYKKEDKTNGKKYWRKKQYITQAIVVEDPLDADDATGETHEGKVRYLTLGYQIYNVIKEAFESGDLDEIPYAYENGFDFVIKKSKQGEYSTYAMGSRFVRQSTSLTEEQLALVEENLGDLKELLPKHPGAERVQGMLEASLTGGSFGGDATPAPAATPAPSAPAADSADAAEASDEADDILQQIRARRAAQNS